MNGESFKAALLTLGWSQQEFADRLGVARETVGRWARNEVPVPGYVIEYLRVLGLARQILEKT